MRRTGPASPRNHGGTTRTGGPPSDIADNAVEAAPRSPTDRLPAGSDSPPNTSSHVPTGAWVAIIALAVIAAVFTGLYLSKDSSPTATRATQSPAVSGEKSVPAPDQEPSAATPDAASESVPAGPPAAVAPTSGRIPSGTYALPDGLSPGAYRVGAGWSVFDTGGELVDFKEMQDGPALLIIPDNAAAGTVEIQGGAVRVDAGPLDPFQYRDGMFVVGYDVEPGTYRVTVATAPVDALVLWRLDEDLKLIATEQSLFPEAGESVTIEVLPTDYALQFEGLLEKVD